MIQTLETVSSTPKAKKCPVKAYFEPVRIVELTALSGDTELF